MSGESPTEPSRTHRSPGAHKKAAPLRVLEGGGWAVGKVPAMTDFRARGTIMGLAGLTAVFGMGTGVAPPVSSPGNRPAGGQATPAASSGDSGLLVTQAEPDRGSAVGVVATNLSPDACRRKEG